MDARDLCVPPDPYRGVQDFFVRIGCIPHKRGVKAMMDPVRIRQATLEDLPLLLHYRRAMAEEMDGADEAAVNRMIAALEPYLRAAISEDRWHSWIVEPSFRRRSNGRQLTPTIIAWCRGRGFEWIYLHARDQGRPLYESLGFLPSSEMHLKL